MPKCPKCQGEIFWHGHNSPYGLAGAHMAGSERYTCKSCNYSIYAGEGKKLGFVFVLD